MTDAYANLQAGFRIGKTNASADLLAHFIVRHEAAAHLLGKLRIKHSSSTSLAAEFVVRRTVLFPPELKAKLIVVRTWAELTQALKVRHSATQELLSKFMVRHADVVDLLAHFTARHSHYENILAKLFVRHSGSADLAAEFFVENAVDLDAEFVVVRRFGSIVPIYGGNLGEWINYVEGLGTGFVMNPEIENDPITRVAGYDSLKINSIRTPHRFDSVRFGYSAYPLKTYNVLRTDISQLKGLVYVDRMPCVSPCTLELVEDEDWHDWVLPSTYTGVLKSTTVRLLYHEHFGHGGWTLADVCYGAEQYLKCSQFSGYYPGELPHYTHKSSEEIMIQFNTAGISIASIGWARFEAYRYAGNASAFNSLIARRIGSAAEVPETYLYWNPANKIGGIYGPPPWFEIDNAPDVGLRWVYCGEWHLTMGGGLWYMGNDGFLRPSPLYYGLSNENAQWDRVEITAILQGWINGTYENQGLGVTGGSIDGGLGFGSSISAGATQTYYSHRAPANKPRIIVQRLEAANWAFIRHQDWEVVDTAFGGVNAIRLYDWSKRNIDEGYSLSIPGMLYSGAPIVEGVAQVQVKLNAATQPVLRYNWNDYNPQIYYTTSLDNSINIQFRYQDTSNYYIVEILPTGKTSRIRRKRLGSFTTLASFDSGIAVLSEETLRVVFLLVGANLCIDCQKAVISGSFTIWQTIGAGSDASPQWPAGGSVKLESYDATVGEIKIYRRTS